MSSRNIFAILFVVLRCLLFKTNAEFRVINGNRINIKDSAHSVSIFQRSKYQCAGSLISLSSVVTEGTCVVTQGHAKGNLRVIAGVDDIGAGRDAAKKRDVCRVICDPPCNERTMIHQIAVVKVVQDFTRGSNIKPVPLCHTELQPDMDLKVNGWGSDREGRMVHNDFLKTTTMRVLPRDECEKQMPTYLSYKHICAECSGRSLGYGDDGAGALVDGHLCAVAHFYNDRLDIPNLFTNLSNEKVRKFLSDYASEEVLL